MRNSAFFLFALALLILLAFRPSTSSAQSDTLVVTQSGDQTVVQEGSLRWAIETAREIPASRGVVIEVALPRNNSLIRLTRPLPAITRELHIRGNGAFLDGVEFSNSAEPVPGLVFAEGADNASVSGLVIQRFSGAGVVVRDADYVSVGKSEDDDFPMVISGNGAGRAEPAQVYLEDADYFRLENALIGFEKFGVEYVVPPGGKKGLGLLAVNSNYIMIGHENNSERGNYIAGNNAGGLYLRGCLGADVRNNFIGTSNNPGEPENAGEQDYGLVLENADACQIGNNVISGNLIAGAYLVGSRNVNIFGNYFGSTEELDEESAYYGNGEDGVRVDGGCRNINIGGLDEGYQNVFADNGRNGVFIKDGARNVRVVFNAYFCFRNDQRPIAHEAANMTAPLEVTTQDCSVRVDMRETGGLLQIYKQNEPCGRRCGPSFPMEFNASGQNERSFSLNEAPSDVAAFAVTAQDPETGNTFEFPETCVFNYKLTLTNLSGDTLRLCPESDSALVRAYDYIDFARAPNELVWIKDGTVIAEGARELTLAEPGEYEIIARHLDDTGGIICDVLAKFYIVKAPLELDAGPDETVLAGDTVQLRATLGAPTNTPDVQIAWRPETGLSNPAALRPLASPAQTTTYTLATRIGACAASDEVTVFVEDKAGGMEWRHSVGGAADERAGAVVADPDNNLYTAGVFRGEAMFGDIQLDAGVEAAIYMLKYTPAGAIEWARAWPSSDSAEVTGLSWMSGSLYMTGAFSGALSIDQEALESAGGLDGFLIKIDTTGGIRWGRGLGGMSVDRVTGVSNAPWGEQVYVSGSFVDAAMLGVESRPLVSAGGQDALVAAFDANGEVVWSETFGSANNDQAADVHYGEDGALYVGGSFAGPMQLERNPDLGPEGMADGFLTKIDTTGGIRWGRGLGGMSVDRVVSVGGDGAGGVIVGGEFNEAIRINEELVEAVGQQDVFLAKIDTTGGIRWGRGLGGMSVDRVADVVSTEQGEVIVTGSFDNAAPIGRRPLVSNGGEDFYLARVAPVTGRVVWSLGGGGTADDRSVALTALPGKGIACVGNYRREAFFNEDRWYAAGGADSYIFRFCRDCNLPTARPETAAKDYAQLTLYPNPATDMLRALTPVAPGSILKFEIISAAGQTVARKEARVSDAGAANLALPELAAGVYVLKAGNGEWRGVARFVVE